MMPAIADAQITIKSKSNTKTLLSIRMGVITLEYEENDCFYLAMSTTNQFDDAIILPLGKDKREAMQTLNDLIDITTSMKKGDSITIESAYDREFRIYRRAKNTIAIYADGYAGSASTNAAELKRILDHLTFEVYE